MGKSAPGSGSVPAKPIVLEVLRVAHGQKVAVRSLVSEIGGLLTHWKVHSQYCDQTTNCRHCRSGTPTQWKGYFAGEGWDAVRKWWVPCVVEVTENCELHMRHRLQRGQTWELSRPPRVKERVPEPLEAMLIEECDPDGLPSAFDLYGVLRTLYHVNHISLTTPNPLPDRTIVEPTAGPEPGSFARTPAIETELSAEQFRHLREKQNRDLANGVVRK
jgi:hypothetical protein